MHMLPPPPPHNKIAEDPQVCQKDIQANLERRQGSDCNLLKYIFLKAFFQICSRP